MRIFDLSQPLNHQVTFWPYYPRFEVKYIKRKTEYGVNAQYIQTPKHMGADLDAPRHFVTAGRTIDEILVDCLCGPGVIVDGARQAEERFGGPEGVRRLFPDSAYQLTHNALFPKDCMHIENLGGEIDAPELQNRRCIVGCFPWKFRGGEAAFARAVAFVGEWPAEDGKTGRR